MCEITHFGMAKRLEKDPILGLKLANWTREIGSEPVQKILAFINYLLVESTKCSQRYNWASVEEIEQLAQFDAPTVKNDRPLVEWAYVIVGTLHAQAYEEIAGCFFPRIQWQREERPIAAL